MRPCLSRSPLRLALVLSVAANLAFLTFVAIHWLGGGMAAAGMRRSPTACFNELVSALPAPDGAILSREVARRMPDLERSRADQRDRISKVVETLGQPVVDGDKIRADTFAALAIDGARSQGYATIVLDSALAMSAAGRAALAAAIHDGQCRGSNW